MNVLFVDDRQDSVAAAVDAVKERLPDVCVKIETSFADAIDTINSFNPDVVVLDLLRDYPAGNSEYEGFEPLKWIWDDRIVSIVVYSAFPNRLKEEWPEISRHKLVRTINKGDQSDIEVAIAIEQLAPYGAILNDARLRVEAELSVMFKQVAPRILNMVGHETSGAVDAIGRATFRRLAALADETGNEMQTSHAWEQYLVPTVSKDLMVGDVIASVDGSLDDPGNFRLVLTPSCDLVVRKDGNANVTSALVAKCFSVAVGLPKAGVIGTSPKSIRRSNLLSQGFSQSVIPMPGLPGVIPPMMANLRELELIRVKDIALRDIDGGIEARFRRIASTDSPYRELISWAYVQIAGRPGMPDRDFDAWSKEISACAKQGQSS